MWFDIINVIILNGDLNIWLSLIYNLNLIIKYKHKQQGIGESKQFIKNKSMSKRRGSVDIALVFDFLLLSVKWQICGKSHIYITTALLIWNCDAQWRIQLFYQYVLKSDAKCRDSYYRFDLNLNCAGLCCPCCFVCNIYPV